MNTNLMNPGMGTPPMPSNELRHQAHDNGMMWREFFFAVQMAMNVMVGRAKVRPPVQPNPFDGLP